MKIFMQLAGIFAGLGAALLAVVSTSGNVNAPNPLSALALAVTSLAFFMGAKDLK